MRICACLCALVRGPKLAEGRRLLQKNPEKMTAVRSGYKDEDEQGALLTGTRGAGGVHENEKETLFAFSMTDS